MRNDGVPTEVVTASIDLVPAVDVTVSERSGGPPVQRIGLVRVFSI